MKKQVFLRGLLGFPIGISIGHLITIFISLFWANGYYSPCVPELIEQVGSEISAVILQTALCGIIGTSFAASSVIWEIDNWGIAKQTSVYFLIISLTMFPIAYFTHWMEYSLRGFICYFGIFLAIFIAMRITQYYIYKIKVVKINSKVNKSK